MRTKQILATAVALTTSSTASTNTANVQECDQHSIYLEWTPGTSSNVLTVTVETRTNGGQWTQDMSWAGTTTLTRNLLSLTHTATGTTVVPLVYDFSRHADELRIKYAESEAGSSTKGTITAYIISSPSRT